MKDAGAGVRYQVHPTKDGRHVLFMASEQAFWKNFCAGIDRNDLFEKWPGSQYGDHARPITYAMRPPAVQLARPKASDLFVHRARS